MSILIKGLNTLNTDNRFQFLFNQDNKFCCREYINCMDENWGLVENGYRDYPIEFLPEKHGRLIDADALPKRDINLANVPYNFIREASTIIEAE